MRTSLRKKIYIFSENLRYFCENLDILIKGNYYDAIDSELPLSNVNYDLSKLVKEDDKGAIWDFTYADWGSQLYVEWTLDITAQDITQFIC